MKLNTTILAAALLIAALAASPLHADTIPSRIAVVNVVKVFNSLNMKNEGDRDIEAMGGKLNADRDALQKEVENLRKELDAYKADSTDYADTSEKLLKKARELQSFNQFMEDKLLLETRVRTAKIYRAMNEAIKSYAEANGIALVLAAEDADLAGARSTQELVSRIAMRKVVYAHSSYDITTYVIEKMNREYKSGAPASMPK